jgi:hypothetical protein
MRKPAKTLYDRIHAEMVDSFDEELELEVDDERLGKLLAEVAEHPGRPLIAASISRSCSASRASWSSCRTGFCAISSSS